MRVLRAFISTWRRRRGQSFWAALRHLCEVESGKKFQMKREIDKIFTSEDVFWRRLTMSQSMFTRRRSSWKIFKFCRRARIHDRAKSLFAPQFLHSLCPNKFVWKPVRWPPRNKLLLWNFFFLANLFFLASNPTKFSTKISAFAFPWEWLKVWTWDWMGIPLSNLLLLLSLPSPFARSFYGL